MADLQTLGRLREEAFKDEAKFFGRLGAKVEECGRSISNRLRRELLLVYEAFRDPATPLSAKLIIAGALAYFILPWDAMPDLLPAVGFTDDAAVVALAARKLQEIVAAHRRTQRIRQRGSDSPDPCQALNKARRENDLLRRESAKWRRVAKCELLLLAVLGALASWLALS